MVHADCSVTVGTNAYSVPWRLIDERIRVYHDRDVVAKHDEYHGRSQIGRTCGGINTGPLQVDVKDEGATEPTLLRPLAEYAAARWARELLSMAVDHDVLSLLDEAGEKQLTLREVGGGWRWR